MQTDQTVLGMPYLFVLTIVARTCPHWKLSIGSPELSIQLSVPNSGNTVVLLMSHFSQIVSAVADQRPS